MKSPYYVVLAVIAVLGPTLMAQQQPAFAGRWEGIAESREVRGTGLGVKLIIVEDDGKITGTVAFYDELLGKDGKWRTAQLSHVRSGIKHRILSPKVAANVLTFEIDPGRAGDRVQHSMELKGENEAVLRHPDVWDDDPFPVILKRKLVSKPKGTKPN